MPRGTSKAPVRHKCGSQLEEAEKGTTAEAPRGSEEMAHVMRLMVQDGGVDSN